MSNRTQKQADEGVAKAPATYSAPEKEQQAVNSQASGPESDSGSDQEKESIPRWRQIEIMSERAELRRAFADLDAESDEFDELEAEVFGSESENEELYQHDEESIEEKAGFEDDTLVDEDLDTDELGTGELDEDTLGNEEFEVIDDD